MTAKYTPYTGSRGLSCEFFADTAAEVVEKIMQSNRTRELLNLNGCAGYRLHGLTLSKARLDSATLNRHADSWAPKTLARTLTIQWQAMQTLPQERSGEDNPIEERVVILEDGTDDAPETEWTWEQDGNEKLVARARATTEIEVNAPPQSPSHVQSA